jgi:hypothetical protein
LIFTATLGIRGREAVAVTSGRLHRPGAITLWLLRGLLSCFHKNLASLEAESLIAVDGRARIRFAFRVTLHDRLIDLQRLAAPVAGPIFFVVAGFAGVGEQKTFAAIDELPAPCLA